MSKHHFPIRYRLERLPFIACAELPELPTIFDDRDVEDSRDDFLKQAQAFSTFAAGAVAMYRRAGIDVDTDFCGRLDDLIADCIRVQLTEHAQSIRDASPAPSSARAA